MNALTVLIVTALFLLASGVSSSIGATNLDSVATVSTSVDHAVVSGSAQDDDSSDDDSSDDDSSDDDSRDDDSSDDD